MRNRIRPQADRFLGCLRAELRARRGAMGIKNEDIGAALGVHASTVSGWFTGSGGTPRLEQLYGLSDVLEFNLGVLVQRAEERASA